MTRPHRPTPKPGSAFGLGFALWFRVLRTAWFGPDRRRHLADRRSHLVDQPPAVTAEFEGTAVTTTTDLTTQPTGARRFQYRDLDSDQRRACEDWCRAHNLEPATIPIDAELGYDPATNEWVIEQYATKNGCKITALDGTPLRVKVRRAVVADPHISWLGLPTASAALATGDDVLSNAIRAVTQAEDEPVSAFNSAL